MQLGRDFSLVTVATATFARPLHQQAVNAFALLQVQINRVRAEQIEEVAFRRGRDDLFAPAPNEEITTDIRVTGLIDERTVEMSKRAIAWIVRQAGFVPFAIVQRAPPLFRVQDVAELAVPLGDLFRENGAGFDGSVRIPTLAEVNALFDRARPPGSPPSSSPGPKTPSTGPSVLKLTVAALVGVPALAWLVRKARP